MNRTVATAVAALLLMACVSDAGDRRVRLTASADVGLEGRGDLRGNNNGGDPKAVVGQNDASDMTDRSRALFRFDLTGCADVVLSGDAIMTLTPLSVRAGLYGHSFLLFKLPKHNADWVEGVGRHPDPGQRVAGVAWDRKDGSRDDPIPWAGGHGEFADGVRFIQALRYGPGRDVGPGGPLVYTIPNDMLKESLAEGVLSVMLMSDIEGHAVQADARIATREHESVEKRPCLTFGAGERLYNGIELPPEWPPRRSTLDRSVPPVPYLEHPPEVIEIDVGRQLFVDDFLIEYTTLQRTYHRPEPFHGNPVLRPDQPWERKGHPGALVYSDGVWYDPADRVFKAWYQAPYSLPRLTCLALSKDGIHWEKPDLGIRPGTNAVLPDPEGLFRDSVTVWLDSEDTDPARRYKLWRSIIEQKEVDGKRSMRKWLTLHFSPDGIHWTHVGDSPSVGDRTTAFYNPFRGVWCLSLRTGYTDVGRSRDYREHPNALEGLQWDGTEQFKWVCADRLDPRNPDPAYSHIPPELYNLDAVAYESVMLGLFSIWQGDPRKLGHPRLRKRNDLLIGFSRDGFHWHRPWRERFVSADPTAGAWNWGNVQSAGGCCLVVGDKLYFYVSGRGVDEQLNGDYVSTGLATLRRDGFASMSAEEAPGVLTTRPVRFSGTRLFVNADVPDGELRVEVLDREGKVVEPFSLANCRAVRADSTIEPVIWETAAGLAATAGQPVRFRFHLRNGALYSFWVSSGESGASRGYVAAGGPGFSGPADTSGTAAYRAAEDVRTVLDRARRTEN